MTFAMTDQALKGARINDVSDLRIGQLEAITGTLSRPSKMPCHGYSIPAQACNVGSKLRGVAGSVCKFCYAMKNRYIFPNVQKAMRYRLASIERDVEHWACAMIELIKRKEKSGFFRWHDSGDLQSEAHLHAINIIAKELPGIKFWLPTREYKIVRAYMKREEIAPNLIIRVSALFTSQTAPDFGLPTSTVGLVSARNQCPAVALKTGKCGDCRKCWTKRVKNVNYPIH